MYVVFPFQPASMAPVPPPSVRFSQEQPCKLGTVLMQFTLHNVDFASIVSQIDLKALIKDNEWALI